MEHDIGLTQQDNYSKKLLSMNIDEYLNYKFINKKLNKSCNLQEFQFVDFTYYQENILLNNERLFYENDNIHIQKVIFSNEEKILLHDCAGKNIIFISCVFMSDIRFSENPKSLSFDSCVFQKTYSTTTSEIESITMTCCVIKHLFLRNMKIGELPITLCQINELSIIDFYAKYASFVDNTISALYFSNSEIEKLEFDYKQLKYFNKLHSVSIRLIKKTIGKKHESNSESLISTLDFIQTLPTIKSNPIICTKIDYVKSIMVNYGSINSVLMRLYGNFMLPSRTIITSIFIIVIFTIIYYINENGLRLVNNIDFYKYFTYSLEAFLGTTKEIKCNLYQPLSYIERIIGFFSVTVFTISLAKKYLK